MKKLRLVERNMGTGGIDYWEIQARTWWFPFWVPRVHYTDKATAIDRYNVMLNTPAPKHIVLLED